MGKSVYPIEYEAHYVAFLDVLGFGELVNASGAPGHDIEALRRVTNATLRLREQETRAFLNRRDRIKSVKARQISDAIVLTSTKLSRPGLKELLAEARHLSAMILYMAHLPIRGAVVRGELCDDGSLLVGPALVQAVRLEKRAKYPRILLDETLGDREFIGDLARGMGHEFRVTWSDGTAYLDPMDLYHGLLRRPGEEDESKRGAYLQSWRTTAEEGLASQCPDVRDKCSWMARLLNDEIGGRASPGVRPL